MLYHRQLLLLIACSAIGYTSRSQQTNKTILVKAFNKKDSSGAAPQYDVHILNPTDSIIYITHSYSILLMEGLLIEKNTLAPVSYKQDTANYVLYYGVRDTGLEYDGTYRRLAFFLLPYQRITFTVSITKFAKYNQLLLEYILLPDFCYKAAKKETQGGSYWIKNYKTQVMKIPLE